jgi:hypothetical protein
MVLDNRSLAAMRAMTESDYGELTYQI